MKALMEHAGLVRRESARGRTLAACVAALVLCAGACLIGTTQGAGIYGDPQSPLSAVANDFVTLVFAIPLLGIATWLYARRARIADHILLASLFYIVYNYIPYAIDVPNRLMLAVYVPLLTAALWTGYAVISERSSAGSSVPAGRGPVMGIFLIGLAVALLVYQGISVVRLFQNGRETIGTTAGVYLADFFVAVPLVLIAGVQSLTGRGLGSFGASAALLGGAALSFGLVILFAVQVVAGLSAATLVDFGVVAGVGAVCLMSFAWRVARDRHPAEAEGPATAV